MPSGSSRDDSDTTRRLERLRRIAHRQDSRFGVFGIRFGWDSILGLVPGVGDAATGVIAAYVVAEAARLGAPKPLLFRMAVNVLVDVVLGSVPLVGDIADVAWKANRRNVALLDRHLRHGQERLQR